MTRMVRARSPLLAFFLAACCVLISIRTLVAVATIPTPPQKFNDVAVANAEATGSDVRTRRDLDVLVELFLAMNPISALNDARVGATQFIVRQSRRKVRMQSSPTPARTANEQLNLLIVGTGVLGRRVAALWKEKFPESRVVGATLTENSHAELKSLGIEPVTIQDLFSSSPLPLYEHVVFAAPPQRSRPDAQASYLAAVRDAISLWNKSSTADLEPGFVFTSAASVFAEDDGGIVDESSPISSSQRAQTLLEPETLVIQAGGTVLRLAGLYDVNRGPHTYWLKVGTVKGSPDGILNMLHYDDAATAVIAALRAGGSDERVFVVSDGTPVTRMEICKSAYEAAILPNASFPKFEAAGAEGSGKMLNASRIRTNLQWSPKYASFSQFMSEV